MNNTLFIYKYIDHPHIPESDLFNTYDLTYCIKITDEEMINILYE
jgi:hypothetical protein